jgi:hypothetical protein
MTKEQAYETKMGKRVFLACLKDITTDEMFVLSAHTKRDDAEIKIHWVKKNSSVFDEKRYKVFVLDVALDEGVKL